MPAASKVTWNEPPEFVIPESNRPSGAPGVPEVTVCGSPAKVHRTTSPMLTVCDSGWKRKLTEATVTVVALAGLVTKSRNAAVAAAMIPARPGLRLAMWPAIEG